MNGCMVIDHRKASLSHTEENEEQIRSTIAVISPKLDEIALGIRAAVACERPCAESRHLRPWLICLPMIPANKRMHGIG